MPSFTRRLTPFLALAGVLVPLATFAFQLPGDTVTVQRFRYFRVLNTLCIDAFDPAHCSEVQTLTTPGGMKGNALVVIAGRLVNVFLGIVGIILVGYLIYGGYTWMTAAGDTERVQAGKDTLTNAVIGIVVIFVAFVVAQFIINALIGATTS